MEKRLREYRESMSVEVVQKLRKQAWPRKATLKRAFWVSAHDVEVDV
jgi:hypothetical protein